MQQLEQLGLETYKKVILKHGVQEPVYGVKIEELQKIRKQIKNGYELSLQLYDTGVYDAMYLAGLIAEPGKMTPDQLQHWAEKANCPALREYTVAWVTAESPYAMQKAMEWIDAGDEHIASTGWATLSSLVAITPDAHLDIPAINALLGRIQTHIHAAPNRVKSAMNGFVIAAGTFIKALNDTAKQTGTAIGPVTVDVGDTACKVPFAPDYIAKAEARNSIGKKKKSARCL
jgi:3-methyladenine DNA glycosylase AlkD